MTAEAELLFDAAISRIKTYGTGSFRKDLPKALQMVGQTYEEAGGITPLHGMVIGAAARRLDEIAKDLGRGAFPDEATAHLASQLREFRHREGG